MRGFPLPKPPTTHPLREPPPIELNILHEYDSCELHHILCSIILIFMIVGLGYIKLAWSRSKAPVHKINIDSPIDIVCAGDLDMLVRQANWFYFAQIK